ncbi:uncharacterized protein LOC117283308 [Fukomys damarensis]|uniref:uncharacterized protein LOC117283308 n=1 Tax=Fukomys damarensis TaxID=885580 RepID=UPI0014550424|nr:uncharacterized protein LOC117283308 [Fukomys damarensis]
MAEEAALPALWAGLPACRHLPSGTAAYLWGARRATPPLGPGLAALCPCGCFVCCPSHLAGPFPAPQGGRSLAARDTGCAGPRNTGQRGSAGWNRGRPVLTVPFRPNSYSRGPVMHLLGCVPGIQVAPVHTAILNPGPWPAPPERARAWLVTLSPGNSGGAGSTLQLNTWAISLDIGARTKLRRNLVRSPFPVYVRQGKTNQRRQLSFLSSCDFSTSHMAYAMSTLCSPELRLFSFVHY